MTSIVNENDQHPDEETPCCPTPLSQSDPSPVMTIKAAVAEIVCTTTTERSVLAIQWGAVANLCSATLGAGVLALPFALQEAGLIWGSLLFAMAAGATLVSMDLLVQGCDALLETTYEGLVEQALGSAGRRITEVSILLFCGGCAVAYIITVGDIMEPLVGHRQLAMLLVWSGAMLPLSLLRTMERLQRASSIGIFSIATLVISAILHLAQYHHHHHEDTPSITLLLWPSNGIASVLRACPIILFAFSCQVNVCAIYAELPQKHLMGGVIRRSVAICALLYAVMAVTAMLEFFPNVQPNVLQNYGPHGFFQLAFCGMALAVVMAFPLNVFPARVTLEGLFHRHHHHDNNDDSDDDHNDNSRRRRRRHPDSSLQQALLDEGESASHDWLALDDYLAQPVVVFHPVRHVCLTLAIAGTALGLALVVPNISIVFGLLGGTTTSVLGFVLPGLLGLKVTEDGADRFTRCKAWALVVGGIVVGIVTTAVTIYSTIF